MSAIIINVRIHTPALLYIHAEIHGPFVSNQRESERAQCRHAPVVIQQSKKEKKKIKTRANIRVLLLLFDRPDSLSAGGFEK